MNSKTPSRLVITGNFVFSRSSSRSGIEIRTEKKQMFYRKKQFCMENNLVSREKQVVEMISDLSSG